MNLKTQKLLVEWRNILGVLTIEKITVVTTTEMGILLSWKQLSLEFEKYENPSTEVDIETLQ